MSLTGQRATVTGMIRSARRQKKYSFLELNDGSCAQSLQVVWGESGAANPTATSPAVISPEDSPRLLTGASVTVHGTLVQSPKAGQAVELQAERVTLEGGVDASYPLQKKAHTLEFQREILHLRPRAPLAAAVLRARHTLSTSIHHSLASRGYCHIHTPILTSNDCEGAGELFTVSTGASGAGGGGGGTGDAGSAGGATGGAPTNTTAAAPFFGRPTHLTVSGQLHLEAFAAGLSRVYAFGPTFRAENSATARHLAEFWMVEPECSPGGLEDAMELCEGVVREGVAALLEREAGELPKQQQLRGGGGGGGEGQFRAVVPGDLETIAKEGGGGGGGVGVSSSSNSNSNNNYEALRARLNKITANPTAATATAIPTLPFPRVSYTEALRLLHEGVAAGKAPPFTVPVPSWGGDLGSEHERWLAEVAFNGSPVFVTHYPATLKPFYMRQCRNSRSSDPGVVVENFDLLVPGLGELAGGSAREEDYGRLGKAMAERGLLSPEVAQAVVVTGGGPSSPLLPPANPSNGTLDWYLDLRRYGGRSSAGWGLGFERLVAWATGIDNVRDAIPCPRTKGGCAM